MLPLQNCVEVAESQQFFSNCSLRINTLWRDSDVSQTETFNIGKRGARGTAGFQFRFREFSVGRFLGRFYSLSATKRLLLGCNQPRPHDARHIHQVGWNRRSLARRWRKFRLEWDWLRAARQTEHTLPGNYASRGKLCTHGYRRKCILVHRRLTTGTLFASYAYGENLSMILWYLPRTIT